MTDEEIAACEDFLLGEIKSLQKEVNQSGKLEVESANQLNSYKEIEAINSIILDGEIVISQLIPAKKKLQHRGAKTTDKIRAKSQNLLPDLKKITEEFTTELIELAKSIKVEEEFQQMPESHLEMLERYTLLAHQSMQLSANLSGAKSDLAYTQGELK